MIRSMTGYARIERPTEWGRLVWELRSVNHRYLDLQFKLPDECRAIESDCRAAAAAKVARGKLEASLRIQREGATAQERLSPSLERLNELKQALAAVSAVFGELPPPDSVRLLSFPGVLAPPLQDPGPLQAEARAGFEQVLEAYNQARAGEGARTARALSERSEALAGWMTQVRRRFPEVRSSWIERLRERFAEAGLEADAPRLEQEMVLALQRLDVDEELSRLDSHRVELRQALGRSDAVGRRLDFLMQEFNREANTLSSKSQDAEMTRCAVEMKVLIEQMREQVQNLE